VEDRVLLRYAERRTFKHRGKEVQAKTMKRVLQMARAPFLVAVIMPVLWGTALAYSQTSTFILSRFLLILAGAVTTHAGANLLNDYYDYRLGADLANPHRNAFSGGSHHIVEGLEPAAVFLRWGMTSLAAAFVCGFALVWSVDRGPGPVLWFLVGGAFCGAAYTAPPFKLSYRGLGEVVIFVAFGMLPVATAYYVQTETLPLTLLPAAFPLAFLITNIIWINEFPDRSSDAVAGKRHLVVRLGPYAARYVYYVLGLFAYITIAWLGSTGITPWILLGLAGAPLTIAAALRLHNACDIPGQLLPAQGMTIAAHFATAAGMCAGLLIGGP
jgi:1,4-dihydroxy-2-naphthoate octaprenyltransferase